MVQWLRLHAPNAEGPGLIAGQGTRFHMLQLDSAYCNEDQRSRLSQLRPSRANKLKKKKESAFLVIPSILPE